MSLFPICVWRPRSRLVNLCWLLALGWLALLWPQASHAQAGASQAGAAQAGTPTIHVPYYVDSTDPAKGAIFWFGKVDPASNYANVRAVYSNRGLAVVLHVFDRLLAYDENATPTSDLTQWDAVTLYLDTQANLAAPLGPGAYRFDIQLSHWQARTNYVRAFRWQSGAWQPAQIDIETAAGFRGYPNDSDDDRGWLADILLPFASLGQNIPATGATWRMALVLHDRDALGGGVLADQSWPAEATLAQPGTWGRIQFSAPAYTPPALTAQRTLTLRHGVDGVQAPDAAVGGHSECGVQFDPNYFDGWGEAKYPGFAQINIQNQWDVADWPCYSKYYVTFPLDTLPASAGVFSATLTMYMFGNAGYVPGDAKPSFMQVARVAEDWSEQTLTWNNAPPVLENYSWTVVTPMADGDPPLKPFTWDVARAVADAHAAGQPLRLVIYSSDGDYHSGKYFWSADAGADRRPVLNIRWGNQGYKLSTVPVRPVIRSGETAQYEINVASIASGETVTLQVGPGSPPGLEITVTPRTVAAPGGKAVVTLTDRQGSSEARAYTVPVQASNGEQVQTAEITVLVNGQSLYLPAVSR